MRKPIHICWALAFAVGPLSTVFAETPPASTAAKTRAPAPVIGSRQIDRYAAIAQLQKAVQANPKSLVDWVILGELAHEVALDSPPDQAARYYKLSREAYERALALAPNNPGLKAAAQFAREHETNLERFDKNRDLATQTYLEARRRDLAATDYTPSVRVDTPPLPDRPMPEPAPAPPVTAQPATTTVPVDPPTVNPALPNTVATDVSNFGTRQIYTSPFSTYQPYYVPQGAPYTYNQYSSSYYTPGYYNAPGAQPMTLQRYIQQPLRNAAGRVLPAPRP